MVLDNLGVLRVYLPYYLFQWYSIIILVGVVLIATRDKIGFGLILTAIGGLFLLDEMSDYYYWRFDFWDVFDFWPLVFIIVGLSLIFRRGRLGDWKEKKN